MPKLTLGVCVCVGQGSGGVHVPGQEHVGGAQ